MRRAFLCVVWVSGWVGCGDDSEAPRTEVPEADAGENNDVEAAPLPSTGDEHFPAEAAVDVRVAFTQDLCARYCLHVVGCGEEGEGCEAGCAEGVAADEDKLAEVQCVLASACGEGCEGVEAEDGECEALCEEAAGCGAFPSDALGPDEGACVRLCSGYVGAQPEVRAGTLACYAAQLEGCLLDNLGECRLDLGPEDTCAEMCERLVRECRAIPGEEFLTVQACLETCRATSPVAQLTMNVCTSVAGCDYFPQCFPVRAEVPEACGPFCTALEGACPGAVPVGACPALCNGLNQGWPGSDLLRGAACLEAAEMCPGDAVYLCVLPEAEGCPDICGALEQCGANVPDCLQSCAYLAAVDPGRMETVRACALESACGNIGVCFD